jgi:peptide-methionine (S)-S-oxide reductase
MIFWSRTVRSPIIGRTLAIIAIVVFFGWNAVRSISARPGAEPRYPFPKPVIDAPFATSKSQQTAVLAGGCFWGVQAVFEHLKGVRSVTAGYSGGRVNSPGYEMVSSGLTGHAESVSITFDASQFRTDRS